MSIPLHSPKPHAEREPAASADARPHAAERPAPQGSLQAMANRSPLMTAQRHQVDALFGSALQREAMPGEDALQMSGATVQREVGLLPKTPVTVTIGQRRVRATILEVLEDGAKYRVQFHPAEVLEGNEGDTFAEADVTRRALAVHGMKLGEAAAKAGSASSSSGSGLGLLDKLNHAKRSVFVDEKQPEADSAPLVLAQKTQSVGDALDVLHNNGQLQDAKAKRTFLAHLDAKLCNTVMLQLYEKPEHAPLLDELSAMQSLDLHPHGHTRHTWSAMAETQLDQLGRSGYQPGAGMAELTETKIKATGRAFDAGKIKAEEKKFEGFPVTSLENVCLNAGQRDWEVLGRTLIFYPMHGQSDRGHVAVKVSKAGEDLGELLKESGMQRILNLAKRLRQHEDHSTLAQADELGLNPRMLAQLSLESTFPEAVGVFMIELPEQYVAALNLKGGKRGIDDQYKQRSGRELFACFVYRTDDYDYFRYINRARDKRTSEGHNTKDVGLQPSELGEGTHRAMHDIFALAGQGWMFTQLIDLYHHNAADFADTHWRVRAMNLKGEADVMRLKDGGGRLLILLDVLRKVGRDRGEGGLLTFGLGKIENIGQAVEYPNVRKTGAADVGDARPFQELMGEIEGLRAYLEKLLPILSVRRPIDPNRENPWDPAFKALRGDPENSDRLGVKKPDLDLAHDIAAVLRQYDAVVQACRSLPKSAWPPFDDCGFNVPEIEAGLENAGEGRKALQQVLIAGSALRPERIDLVRDAYDVLPGPVEDGGLSEELQAVRKQEAASGLEKQAKSGDHAGQAARHALFADVRHLLLPAEKPKPLVAPYVMASYLSEYLVSHLLLTSTWFTLDPQKADSLQSELHHPGGEKPTLEALCGTLLSGCVDAVLGFAHLDPQHAGDLVQVVSRMADFPRLGRQVAFFMTAEYHKVWLTDRQFMSLQEDRASDGGPLPIDTSLARAHDEKAVSHMTGNLGLYPASATLALDNYDSTHKHQHAMRREHWNPNWDKSGPGYGKDLGAYNGQMPIKEFEQLAYRLVPYLMLKQQEQQAKQ